MPEMLDIVDENGVPTGRSVPRTVAHAEGLRHRTSHVWIVRRKAGRVQVLLQMRCAAKDSYPGCYDISSAGHIPAGDEFVGSALRELREELGVDARAEDLHECGLRRFRFEAEFHSKPFKDNQVSKVFCLWLVFFRFYFRAPPALIPFSTSFHNPLLMICTMSNTISPSEAFRFISMVADNLAGLS